MRFLNQQDFDNPMMWLLAAGGDPDPKKAVVDGRGNVLFHARTGGMINPKRHELAVGTKIFRFGSGSADADTLANGGWWVEPKEFNKLLSFAQQHNIGVGVALRSLAMVPPEWSDLAKLIRVQLRAPLLAMRGLGETAIVDGGDGLGMVHMKHQNHNPARRLHQLFIPGLRNPGLARQAIAIENVYDLGKEGSLRGFLYL